MVIDRRALILTELESLLSTLSITLTGGKVIAPGNFVRNRNELTKEKRPGIILLDADEVADPRVPLMATGRDTAVAPRIMKMTPEIYGVLEERKPQNKNIGEDVTIIRQAIVSAVLLDKTLRDITGSNGTISYDGCVTDLARNRVMEGQIGLSITFTYPFIPFEITGQS